MTAALRVGIAGVHGHGRSHVEAALALGSGVELAAVADPRGPGVVPASTRWFDDASEMIRAADLDVVVLSTPIPTHAQLAIAALGAGAHVLLEKPPVVSIEEHRQVQDAASRADRFVQVGFQSLASEGIAAARDLARSGELGELEHIGAVGLWSRSEEYWRRAPWSGYRVRDGRLVADGAVTNPLAHAVATALAIGGVETDADLRGIRLDMRRANDIETDDTSSLVIDLVSGGRIAAALSVTAPRRHEPYVLLRGTRGHAVYFYTLDLLEIRRAGASLPRMHAFARVGPLANLVAAIRGEDALRVPLASTGAFTRVLEEVVASPMPRRIAAPAYRVVERDDQAFRVVRNVEELSERVAWEARTFDELGAEWDD